MDKLRQFEVTQAVSKTFAINFQAAQVAMLAGWSTFHSALGTANYSDRTSHSHNARLRRLWCYCAAGSTDQNRKTHSSCSPRSLCKTVQRTGRFSNAETEQQRITPKTVGSTNFDFDVITFKPWKRTADWRYCTWILKLDESIMVVYVKKHRILWSSPKQTPQTSLRCPLLKLSARSITKAMNVTIPAMTCVKIEIGDLLIIVHWWRLTHRVSTLQSSESPIHWPNWAQVVKLLIYNFCVMTKCSGVGRKIYSIIYMAILNSYKLGISRYSLWLLQLDPIQPYSPRCITWRWLWAS